MRYCQQQTYTPCFWHHYNTTTFYIGNTCCTNFHSYGIGSYWFVDPNTTSCLTKLHNLNLNPACVLCLFVYLKLLWLTLKDARVAGWGSELFGAAGVTGRAGIALHLFESVCNVSGSSNLRQGFLYGVTWPHDFLFDLRMMGVVGLLVTIVVGACIENRWVCGVVVVVVILVDVVNGWLIDFYFVQFSRMPLQLLLIMCIAVSVVLVIIVDGHCKFKITMQFVVVAVWWTCCMYCNHLLLLLIGCW